MVSSKPSKFVLTLENELHNVRIAKLEAMAAKVSERDLRFEEEKKLREPTLPFKL